MSDFLFQIWGSCWTLNKRRYFEFLCISIADFLLKESLSFPLSPSASSLLVFSVYYCKAFILRQLLWFGKIWILYYKKITFQITSSWEFMADSLCLIAGLLQFGHTKVSLNTATDCTWSQICSPSSKKLFQCQREFDVHIHNSCGHAAVSSHCFSYSDCNIRE